MRKTVEIIGIGQRKAGISKKGIPYDFTDLCIVYDDFRITGRKAETVVVSQDVLDGVMLQPGMIVDVQMWQQNFQTRIGVIYD